MTSIQNRTACAKRGGPNFLETVRVDRRTGRCPKGYVACSPFTAQTDTVCMLPGQEYNCPIIDLFVVHETMTTYLKLNGFSVTEMGYPQDGNFETFIAFSKYTTR